MAEEQPPNSDIPSPDPSAASSSPGGLDALDQSAIEELLKGANFEDAPATDDAPTAEAQSAAANAASADALTAFYDGLDMPSRLASLGIPRDDFDLGDPCIAS